MCIAGIMFPYVIYWTALLDCIRYSSVIQGFQVIERNKYQVKHLHKAHPIMLSALQIRERLCKFAFGLVGIPVQILLQTALGCDAYYSPNRTVANLKATFSYLSKC